MRCSHCKLENPAIAERCDCGFVFATGNLDQNIVREQRPTIEFGYKILSAAAGAVTTMLGFLPMIIIVLAVASAYTHYSRKFPYVAKQLAIWFTVSFVIAMAIGLLLAGLAKMGST